MGAFVQSQTAGDSAAGTTVAATFGSNVTAGNLIHVFILYRTSEGTGHSVADNLGNTYTLIDAPVRGNRQMAHYYAANIAGGACTVTLTTPNSNQFRSLAVVEISGLDTATPLDVHSSNVQETPGTGTDAVVSGSATATAAGYLSACGIQVNDIGAGGPPAAGTGFTDDGTALPPVSLNQARLEHAAVTAGSRQATFTAGSNVAHTAIMAIFKDAGSTNDVAAAGSLSITGAADLNATGALVAAGAASITGVAALNAAGTLTGAGSLAITGAAALDAVGALTAVGSVAITGAASLDATGALSAAGAVSITGSADLNGAGGSDLAAAGALSITGNAILDATGALSAAGAISVTGAADINATGALAAAGSASITGLADLTATTASDMSASGTLSVTGGAALSAIGALIAHGTIRITGVADLVPPSSRPAGGDDIPRRSPHTGWNRRREELKRSQEQRFLADIRAIYRELTDEPELRERAIEVVAEAQPEVRAQLRETDRDDDRVRIAHIRRRTDDLETSLRLMAAELVELRETHEREDEHAIHRALMELI